MDCHASGNLVSSWLLKWVMIMGLVAFSPAIADDPTGVPPPASNSLCISECGTCPVICSPQPPPPEYKFYSPPMIYMAHHPPPPPPHHPLAPPPFHIPPSPPYINNPNVPSVPPPPATGSRGYAHPYYYFYSSSYCAWLKYCP